MTPEEFQAAQVTLAQVDTEIAALYQESRDCTAAAREFNDKSRAALTARTVLATKSQPLRDQCAAFIVEERRRQAEAARAEAEAKEKERQEAAKAEATSKAKEASEVEALRARVAELEAAKG